MSRIKAVQENWCTCTGFLKNRCSSDPHFLIQEIILKTEFRTTGNELIYHIDVKAQISNMSPISPHRKVPISKAVASHFGRIDTSTIA